jgi:hypothetical protein
VRFSIAHLRARFPCSRVPPRPCCTLPLRLSVEFEINLIIHFQDHYSVTENCACLMLGGALVCATPFLVYLWVGVGWCGVVQQHTERGARLLVAAACCGC